MRITGPSSPRRTPERAKGRVCGARTTQAEGLRYKAGMRDLGACLACVLLAGLALAAAPGPETSYTTAMARFAAFISDGEPVGALEAVDKSTKGYGAIGEDLQALAAQTEVLCSIDIVEDKEAGDDGSDVHHLDVDWYMVLKSRTDAGLVERRRKRVAVTIQRFSVKSGPVWRIVSLAPLDILAPIAIR
jgi:hypothetical protein